MPDRIRILTEELELANLSPRAAKARDSGGREREEAHDPVRTCFQRDRDRILHSKSFRRLKHKTQVFIDPADHYRTRLTHSLEVSQIARTIGRALRLNEDLIEAIAIGHDVGHPPFGHAGEAALDDALAMLRATGNKEAPDQFRHYDQSLRVLDILENLNLSAEVRAGIGGHSKGRGDLSAFDGEPTSTLEAAVVRISDRIAYLNHDLDDALRSGILDRIPADFAAIGETHGRRIGRMVEDCILHSLDAPSIVLSPEMLDALNRIKEFMFANVYEAYPVRFPDIDKAQAVVRELFTYYHTHPQALPPGFSGVTGVLDYVSGMTDRFAIRTFEALRVPQGFK